MIMTKENDFSYAENDSLCWGTMAVLGDREAQEDCFGYTAKNGNLLLCVCDGMGGYAGGNIASRTAVETILKEFECSTLMDYPAALLHELTLKANNKVFGLHSTMANASNAGSTLVMVFVRDNLLYWSAVGDSRLYIFRNGEFIQTTKDQNYYTVLCEKRNAGQITEEEFLKEQERGDALVNYLGIGALSLIDSNSEPLRLKPNDRLIICTDGLYKMLSDKELVEILDSAYDVQTILQQLEFAVRKSSEEKNLRRDNMTVSLIKVK